MSSMDCAQALALLQDYLKEELPPEVGRRIEAHLAACRPCFQNAAFERHFLITLERALRECTCPESLRQSIVDALRRA
jgi:anti-sigma factor (TIGR02949 family)